MHAWVVIRKGVCGFFMGEQRQGRRLIQFQMLIVCRRFHVLMLIIDHPVALTTLVTCSPHCSAQDVGHVLPWGQGGAAITGTLTDLC